MFCVHLKECSQKANLHSGQRFPVANKRRSSGVLLRSACIDWLHALEPIMSGIMPACLSQLNLLLDSTLLDIDCTVPVCAS